MLDAPPTTTHAYGISCGLPAEVFFRLLAHGKVGLLVDTRLSRSYQSARFADAVDLPYLCKMHGVDYVAIDELAPTRELRNTLAAAFTDVKKADERNPEAWTQFLEGYARLLTDRKFLRVDGPTHRVLFAQKHRSVAFLCACGQSDDCHRSVLLGLLHTFVRGVEVGQLMPSMLEEKGIEDPSFKSPRRYRVRPIPYTGLRANAKEAVLRELERWQKRQVGGAP